MHTCFPTTSESPDFAESQGFLLVTLLSLSLDTNDVVFDL